MLLLLFHFKIGIVIWLRTGRRRAAQGAQPPAMSVPLGLGYSLPHFRFNYKIRLSQTFCVCADQKHTFCLSTANKYDFCRTEVFFTQRIQQSPRRRDGRGFAVGMMKCLARTGADRRRMRKEETHRQQLHNT